jgi:hypothetical protein
MPLLASVLFTMVVLAGLLGAWCLTVILLSDTIS